VSDDTVRAALRSDAPLVLVEAPAGCGKTHQGADYAREVATLNPSRRLLIITHTHAACAMFADRTRGAGPRIEIRTIDSLISQIAVAYHAGLGLPADTVAWVRQHEDRYAELAVKVAALLKRHPMIVASLVRRYPIVICDEHQDSSGEQHAVLMAFLGQGAKLRVFADPMQKIFSDRWRAGGCPPCDWDALKTEADAFEELDVPHRWSGGCPELGQWTLAARNRLKTGGRINLRTGLPSSVCVVFAENEGRRNLEFHLSGVTRRPVDAFEQQQHSSLLILTRNNDTARSFRGFFNRRIPLWEGHTRPSLERLVESLRSGVGDPEALATAVVEFLGRIGKGFSPSAFGDTFQEEVRARCKAVRQGKPAVIQQLARLLMDEPDHRGVAKVLRRLSELKASESKFSAVEMDLYREFWEAIRLGGFDTPDAGLNEIAHRRTYSRPMPPEKAISTIHKAKGLECGSVIVMPCDATVFPDKPDARCLLYVAISRAKTRLMLVVSRSKPSPLLMI
jgi:hypothetical protein